MSENTFPNPLTMYERDQDNARKCGRVARRRMVDDSNVAVDRMSDSWTGFTKFTLLCEKTFEKDICGPGGG